MSQDKMDNSSGSDPATIALLTQGLDRIPVPMHVINPDYRILYTNEAAAALVGKKREDILGKKCYDIYRSPNCNTPECPCRVAMEKGILYSVDISMGDVVIEGTGAPLTDSAGTVIGAIEYFPDVTEQKRAVADILNVAKKAKNGDLSARTDLTIHTGDFKEMAVGINEILEAVIGPLNLTANYIERISKGDIPEKITVHCNGDFDTMKNDLNRCIDALNTLQGNLQDAIVLQKAGDIDGRCREEGLQGMYLNLGKGVNEVLDTINTPIFELIEHLNEYARGDLSKDMRKLPGKQIVLTEGLNSIRNNLMALIADANMLSVAAVEGRLATRADATKHQGDYRKVIEGVNQTLDAVIGPLNVAIDYFERIGNGDIPDKRTNRVNGDIIAMQNSINNCVDNIKALVADANMLSVAAVEGRLATRADATKHQGDYRKIIEGVNQTLDAVIEPVNEAMRVANEFSQYNYNARIDKNLRVAGDFIKFRDALDNIGITVSAAIRDIGVQVTDLAASAEEANASVEEVVSGAQQVAESAGKVSSNAEKGNQGLEQVLKAMEDLSAAVEEVTANTEAVATLANSANAHSKDGAELARKAEQGMVGITRSATDVDQIIGEIKVEMQKIGKIVGLITDLANQTNLLALNAAIEAARAGDAGRGFAVVAAEVKSLAQESRTSAESIAEMIGGLQQKSEMAALATASASKEVGEGSAVLSETLNVFNRIVADVEKITRSVEEVASASEEQAATVEEITASIHEVSTLVDGTASDAGDAAAASEESSAAIDEVGKIVENLNVIVDKVSSGIGKFRV